METACSRSKGRGSWQHTTGSRIRGRMQLISDNSMKGPRKKGADNRMETACSRSKGRSSWQKTTGCRIRGRMQLISDNSMEDPRKKAAENRKETACSKAKGWGSWQQTTESRIKGRMQLRVPRKEDLYGRGLRWNKQDMKIYLKNIA